MNNNNNNNNTFCLFVCFMALLFVAVLLFVFLTVGGDQRVSVHVGHQVSGILQEHVGLLCNTHTRARARWKQ